MGHISGPLTADHRHCDESFVAVERAIAKGEWDRAKSGMTAFADEMERHFAVEEGELFPALQQASVGAEGPVRVMLIEHTQMRHLMAELNRALQQRSIEDCLGITETLLVTMKQHNKKEETILYPMADRAIGSLDRITGNTS